MDIGRPRRSSQCFMQLLRLAHIVQPVLERYYMTVTVLRQSATAPLTEVELERRCHLLAQKISMLHGINAPDFYDHLLFQDFIATMLTKEYLVENHSKQLEFKQGADSSGLEELRSLLSAEVRGSILALINANPH